MKKEGSKKYFRSAAKRTAYEHLELQLKTAQRKLRDNRWEIAKLAREQRTLKADIAGIAQVMEEFKK